MSGGCLCINCREATAMGLKLQEERRQDFEMWLARRQDRLGKFPPLPPDQETRARAASRLPVAKVSVVG